jgi:hypothetical protein
MDDYDSSYDTLVEAVHNAHEAMVRENADWAHVYDVQLMRMEWDNKTGLGRER